MKLTRSSHPGITVYRALTLALLGGTIAGCSSDSSRFSYYDALNGAQTTASVRAPFSSDLAPVGVGTQAYPGDYRAPTSYQQNPIGAQNQVQLSHNNASYGAVGLPANQQMSQQVNQQTSQLAYPLTNQDAQTQAQPRYMPPNYAVSPIQTASIATPSIGPSTGRSTGALARNSAQLSSAVTVPPSQPTALMGAQNTVPHYGVAPAQPVVQNTVNTASAGQNVSSKPSFFNRIKGVLSGDNGAQTTQVSTAASTARSGQAQPLENVASRSPIIRPSAPAYDPVTTASIGNGSIEKPATEFKPMAPDPLVTGSIPPKTTPAGGWTIEGGTSVEIKPGETVYNLSRRYGVPAAEILKANRITNSRSIRSGQQLVIPIYVYSTKAPVSAPDNDVLTQAAYSHSGSQTIFPKGANVPLPTNRGQAFPKSGASPKVQIAPKATNAAQLENQAVQKSNSPIVRPTDPSGISKSQTYKVVSGDTLNRIAYRHKVKVADLKAANKIDGSNIQIGQTLVIPGGSFKPMTPDRTTTASVTPRMAKKPTIDRTSDEIASTPKVQDNKGETITQTAKADINVITPEKTGIGKLRWPARGQITSSFGSKIGNKKSDGIVISMPEGSEVKAAENGVVIYADNGLKGYGETVLIRHDGDIVTVYAHAKELKVKRGDKVQRGQTIALSGMSGSAKRPQLHFEVREKATPRNPITFLE